MTQQLDFVGKVVKEEEDAFLTTLDKALTNSNQIIHNVFVEGISENLILNNLKVSNENTTKQPFDLLVTTEDGRRLAIEIKAGNIDKRAIAPKATLNQSNRRIHDEKDNNDEKAYIIPIVHHTRPPCACPKLVADRKWNQQWL